MALEPGKESITVNGIHKTKQKSHDPLPEDTNRYVKTSK